MAIENFKTTLKKWNSVFCSGMVCKTNIKRDVIVVSFAILAAAVFLYSSLRAPTQSAAPENPARAISAIRENSEDDGRGAVSEKESPEPVLTEEKISAEVEEKIKLIDSSGWKTFKNQFWGFSVKYPGEWLAPKSQSKPAGSKWEARYQFRKRDAGENPYLGFDVAVYDVPKTKEVANTDEYPSLKNPERKTDTRCQNIAGHAIDIDDFPAEEIYIPPTDDCYNSTLFFSIVKERYIYNIVPIVKSETGQANDPRIAVNGQFPEYYFASSTLGLIDIVRPKPAPPKPKITAPKPVSFKVVGGRLVCAKKNDKPRKSRQNKGKHLDMECCLDPDEYPNPWCTY